MTQETEFSESKFLAELRSVVEDIGGELYITLNNNDMSYTVNYSRGGIPFKISLEALEAVCSTNEPGSLRETLLDATSPDVTKRDRQNKLICDLINVSDEISKHTEAKQERAEKLKDIVQKIMPAQMERYVHLNEDMSADPFKRFDTDDVDNLLVTGMKYDLIQYIANI